MGFSVLLDLSWHSIELFVDRLGGIELHLLNVVHDRPIDNSGESLRSSHWPSHLLLSIGDGFHDFSIFAVFSAKNIIIVPLKNKWGWSWPVVLMMMMPFLMVSLLMFLVVLQLGLRLHLNSSGYFLSIILRLLLNKCRISSWISYGGVLNSFLFLNS